MSGGTFDYLQYRISDAADTLHELAGKNAAEFPKEYNPKVVERLHLVATVVSLASELLHDADWFLAGDTGKEDMLIDTDATLANLRTILEAHGE